MACPQLCGVCAASAPEHRWQRRQEGDGGGVEDIRYRGAGSREGERRAETCAHAPPWQYTAIRPPPEAPIWTQQSAEDRQSARSIGQSNVDLRNPALRRRRWRKRAKKGGSKTESSHPRRHRIPSGSQGPGMVAPGGAVADMAPSRTKCRRIPAPL